MARFYTYAQVLTPDDVQWEAHRRGFGCGPAPGLALGEVVERAGGYVTTMPFGESLREQARICAEVSGDPEMARIAGLTEVSISLEHLRGLDPDTRITLGYGIGDFTEAERERFPRDEGPVDPNRIFEGFRTPGIG